MKSSTILVTSTFSRGADRRRASKRILALLMTGAVAFSVTGGMPAAAFTQSEWSALVDLSADGQDAQTPQVALSSDGSKATAVWTRSNGTNIILQSASATVSAGSATWGTTTDVSAVGQNAINPQLALSADGSKATVVWTDASSDVIRSASATISAATATWGTIAEVSDGSRKAGEPQVAMSTNGSTAVAIWRWQDTSVTTDYLVQSEVASIAGTVQTWSTTNTLSSTGKDAETPQIVVSSDGSKATAIWLRPDDITPNNMRVQSASATITVGVADWGSAYDVSMSTGVSKSPQLAMSEDGTQATAVWRFAQSETELTVQSASATISGKTAGWSTPTDLVNPATSFVDGPQVALSADGSKAVAVWRQAGVTDRGIYSALASVTPGVTPGATWGSVSTLFAPTSGTDNPQVAMSADGSKATAIWPASGTRTSSATISSGSATWGTSGLLSVAAESTTTPQVALSSDGSKAISVWEKTTGTDRVQSATAPVASGPGAPGTPTPTAGDGSVSLAWTAPTTGTTPASYTVTASPGGATCTATAPTLTCTVNGLTNGTAYTFTVTATNANGTSAPSSASTSSTPMASGGGGGDSGGGGSAAPASSATPTPKPTPTTTIKPVADPLGPVVNTQNTNIPSGGLPAGDAVLLSNGAPVAVNVEPNAAKDPTSLVISAPALQPPLNMTLEGRGDDTDPLGLTSKQALVLETQPVARTLRMKGAAPAVRVQPVAVATGSGFKPNSIVRFFLLPGTEIGTLTTDAAGAYNGRVPVPAALRAGVYTLQSNGLAPDDTVRSLSLGVLVKEAAASVRVRTAKSSIFFDKLSADLTPSSKSALRKLVAKTGKKVDSVKSVGFVQASGSSNNNQSLSTQRARNVVAYLKSLGVKGAFTVLGNGVANESGSQARRVDVSITYGRK
jgi:outer membrane protein OmpA-like peptidoglycan-associated protein